MLPKTVDYNGRRRMLWRSSGGAVIRWLWALAFAVVGALFVAWLPVPLRFAIPVCIVVALATALLRREWRAAAAGFAVGGTLWGGVLVLLLSRVGSGMSGFD